MAEATHPPGIVVEIVGIEKEDRGRSCEEHAVCGVVVEEDTLLRLRKEPSYPCGLSHLRSNLLAKVPACMRPQTARRISRYTTPFFAWCLD